MCGEERKLIEAHIIPRSLYPFDETKEPLVTVYQHKHTGKTLRGSSPKGEYDSTIVCEECERIFSKPDDYVCDIFRHHFDQMFTLHPSQESPQKIDYYQADSFEYDLLKRFMLSMLWRAHHSSRDFFNRVNLSAEKEEELKTLLLVESAISPEAYPFILRRYDGDMLGAFMDPIPRVHSQKGFLRFYFLTYSVDIQIDPGPMPFPLNNLNPTPEQPLRILQTQLKDSKEYPRMVQMVKDAEEERQRKLGHLDSRLDSHP